MQKRLRTISFYKQTKLKFEYWIRSFLEGAQFCSFSQTRTWTHWLYSMVLINVFGAFFGIMTSRLLFRSEMQPRHEKEKVGKRTGLFAMFGECIQVHT